MVDQNRSAVAGVDPAPAVSAEQTSDNSWPKPGDEGYVVPDGTEQSKRQLADNRRAAADRMAAGSTVHGAPMATPGPQMQAQAAAAVARAEDYDGLTDADRRKGVTESIREGLKAAADEVSDSESGAASGRADSRPADAKPAADQRTADVSKGQAKR